MRRLRYSVPYIAGKTCQKIVIPPHAGRDSPGTGRPNWPIFIHPPLAGRDREWRRVHCGTPISIHPPLAGRDRRTGVRAGQVGISIHPPIAGGTPRTVSPIAVPFISIHRLRAGLVLIGTLKRCGEFQSTRPLAGRDQIGARAELTRIISIHRPLRGGTSPIKQHPYMSRFQSTRPLRGGTAGACGAVRTVLYFNPPAPCGAGLRFAPD